MFYIWHSVSSGNVAPMFYPLVFAFHFGIKTENLPLLLQMKRKKTTTFPVQDLNATWKKIPQVLASSTKNELKCTSGWLCAKPFNYIQNSPHHSVPCWPRLSSCAVERTNEPRDWLGPVRPLTKSNN